MTDLSNYQVNHSRTSKGMFTEVLDLRSNALSRMPGVFNTPEAVAQVLYARKVMAGAAR